MKSNETAIISLPTYLLVVIIVTSIATILLTMGVFDLQKNLQTQQIENQIETILMKAKTISAASVDESSLILTVDFPQQMKTTVFGAVPSQNNTNEASFLRTNYTKKSISVVFEDHQQIIKHTSTLFSGKSVETYGELAPGSYEIVLKLVQQNGETYVQIYKAG